MYGRLQDPHYTPASHCFVVAGQPFVGKLAGEQTDHMTKGRPVGTGAIQFPHLNALLVDQASHGVLGLSNEKINLLLVSLCQVYAYAC